MLAIREGAAENATALKRSLVIDGSKGVAHGNQCVFGSQHPVQRCRAHTLRNGMDHWPKDQKDQVKSAMRAAWRLNAKGGVAPRRTFKK